MQLLYFLKASYELSLFLPVSIGLVAYMRTSIDGGPGCLTLRCPDPSCGAAVGQDMINLLVSDDDKEKYARYLLRSYIEANRKV